MSLFEASTTYARRVPTRFDGIPNRVSGNNIYRLSDGRLIGQLEPATSVPLEPGNLLSQFLPKLASLGSPAAVLNLGISVASFVYMKSQFEKLDARLDAIDAKLDVIDQKLDLVLAKLAQIQQGVRSINSNLLGLAGLIDRRHREEILSNLLALLELLSHADGKPPEKMAEIVRANLLPAKQALYRFDNLIGEYGEKVAPDSPGQVEIMEMQTLRTMTSAKLDMAIGEHERAAELLSAQAESLRQEALRLVAIWRSVHPFQEWGSELVDSGTLDPEGAANHVIGLIAGLRRIDPHKVLLEEFLSVRHRKTLQLNHDQLINAGKELLKYFDLRVNWPKNYNIPRNGYIYQPVDWENPPKIWEVRAIGNTLTSETLKDISKASGISIYVEHLAIGEHEKFFELLEPVFSWIVNNHQQDPSKEKWIDFGSMFMQQIQQCPFLIIKEPDLANESTAPKTHQSATDLLAATEKLHGLIASLEGAAFEAALAIEDPEQLHALTDGNAQPFQNQIYLVTGAEHLATAGHGVTIEA